uniref:Uncharacterized protein n=1 Tax=Anguilla anguilla TaxID=7936 RepID=A0A0E9XNY7_ANGAN
MTGYNTTTSSFAICSQDYSVIFTVFHKNGASRLIQTYFALPCFLSLSPFLARKAKWVKHMRN